MKSATQSAYEKAEKENHERRLHWMHRMFAEKYAPDDPRDRDVFGADLAMLLREIQIDTLKPFQDAAALQISMRPMPPIFVKNDKDNSIATRIFNPIASKHNP